MNVPEHIVKALIALGDPEGGAERTELLVVLDPFHRKAHEHNPNGDWKKTAAECTPNELRNMIRGVVYAEEHGNWYGGSVSIAITLFRAYQQLRQPDEEELAEWVMQHSSNAWAPFGSMRGGARTLQEIREQNERSYVRKMAAAKEEKRRAEEGAQKKKEASERHVLRSAQQTDAVDLRNGEMYALRAKPLQQRVAAIVDDHTRPLSYYHPDLVDGDLINVLAEHSELLTRLAHRIDASRDRRWRRWAKEKLAPLLSKEMNGSSDRKE